MNWSEIQGRWDKMQSLLKSTWPQLTEEEIAGTDADREKLSHILQVRYGYSKEAAQGAICQFEKEVRFPGAVK